MGKIRDKKLNTNGVHVYLAAPFFNPRQIAAVDMMAKQLTTLTKLPVFSPKDSGGILKPMSSAADRRKVVDSNKEGILKSLFVLAMLDFPQQDPNHELRLCRPTTMRAGARALGQGEPPLLGEMLSPALRFTDNGVAWELGFAVAAAIPVIGYVHDRKLVTQLNVMLSDTTEGVLLGEQELIKFLGSFKGIDAPEVFPWQELKPWQQKTQ